jgi:hypothetical protein
MPLSLCILGVPLLRRAVGGIERELHVQAKRLALLSFLAVAEPPGWCRRETLTALFWPEAMSTTHAARSTKPSTN